MSTSMPNIYHIVTSRVIEALEQGIVPWKQTWNSSNAPQNLITSRPYRGINTWLLLMNPFSSNYYLSMQQVNRIGGQVKKGERSCPVVFWKRKETENKETGEKKQSWIIRYYNVFNVDQCSGIPEHFIPKNEEKDNKSIEACKKVIAGMPQPPSLFTKSENPLYNIETDTIHMPPLKSFKSSEAYYVTHFHELIHSTGHQSRLNREGIIVPTHFGSPLYALEELVAEMGACFLASACNIGEIEFPNSAAYIDGWLSKLRKDNKLLFTASGQAQKAVDYILGTMPIYENEIPKIEVVSQ